LQKDDGMGDGSVVSAYTFRSFCFNPDAVAGDWQEFG
jgi:hypothetical protein